MRRDAFLKYLSVYQSGPFDFIVVPRSKPVVSMLEDIRVYVMERWQLNRETIAKYVDGEVLPNIKKKLEKKSSYTNNWLARWR